MPLRWIILLLSTAPLVTASGDIIIGKSLNHSLRVHEMVRAAVANSKIVKLRNINKQTLLLTGMRVGTTMVRVWSRDDTETAHVVRVVDTNIATGLTKANSESIVKIEMEFMELDLSNSQELGIKWPESLELRSVGQFHGSMNTSGLNYSVSAMTPKTILNFLLREGFAKTVANPEIFVKLGEQAVFHAGGEIPVPSSSQSFGNFVKRIEWKAYGLSIHVRPSSEDGYRIQSDVKIDISELTRDTAVDGIPGLNCRKMETKMESVDGSTVVLSALLKQNTAKQKEGLPFFSTIPILGGLFSSQNSLAEKTELIVAMTFSFLNSEIERQRVEQFRLNFHDRSF